MTDKMTGRQFHNQPEKSHLHGFLVDLWEEVRLATDGKVDISVHPQNAGIPGSDPAALKMLLAGEVEFILLMGGLLADLVPAASVQGLPFAFTSQERVREVDDGPLGQYLRRELLAHGLCGFEGGLMENGFRHIVMREKPIRVVSDLEGVRMRVPDSEMFVDTFTALGAVPVIANISELYESLATCRVDGQENPLAVCEVNRLYEVTRHVSLTSHMWSGFNLLGNLGFVRALPPGVIDIVNRAVKRHVARQCAYTDQFNRDLEKGLADRGMVFNTADVAGFRKALAADFYRRAKDRIGTTAWRLLEDGVGRLG